MLKNIICIVFVSIFLLNSSFVFSLSNKEHESFKKESTNYEDADSSLSSTWNNLKNNLPKDIFKLVLEDQRHWLKNVRDPMAEYLYSKELFYNSSKADAYAIVTKKRAEQLELYLKEPPFFEELAPGYDECSKNLKLEEPQLVQCLTNARNYWSIQVDKKIAEIKDSVCFNKRNNVEDCISTVDSFKKSFFDFMYSSSGFYYDNHGGTMANIESISYEINQLKNLHDSLNFF